jgi:hypothetical protein
MNANNPFHRRRGLHLWLDGPAELVGYHSDFQWEPRTNWNFLGDELAVLNDSGTRRNVEFDRQPRIADAKAPDVTSIQTERAIIDQ